VRIIAVGGAGTIGRAVVELLSARHDVVVAGRTSGAVQVDISSPDSVRSMYEQVGGFDALVCTAGEAYFGPFERVTEEELALGVHSKLLGQIRLVLLGRSLISHGVFGDLAQASLSTVNARRDDIGGTRATCRSAHGIIKCLAGPVQHRLVPVAPD
jgi:NAD(P)-dependent dehydrogenase (short-subunit alcohol dehydrogenase family)